MIYSCYLPYNKVEIYIGQTITVRTPVDTYHGQVFDIRKACEKRCSFCNNGRRVGIKTEGKHHWVCLADTRVVIPHTFATKINSVREI